MPHLCRSPLTLGLWYVILYLRVADSKCGCFCLVFARNWLQLANSFDKCYFEQYYCIGLYYERRFSANMWSWELGNCGPWRCQDYRIQESKCMLLLFLFVKMTRATVVLLFENRKHCSLKIWTMESWLSEVSHSSESQPYFFRYLLLTFERTI